MAKPIRNIVVVSDLHCGCQLGLCPPGGARLDEGGQYQPNKLQRKLWTIWHKFWREFVPAATKGEPYAVVVNGDSIDGSHHNSTHQITHNLEDQSQIAYEVLRPIADLCNGRFFMVRGTEAHVGKSGLEEERLAKRLGAVRNEGGQHSRYDLWMRCGDGLVHLLHHIGTTSSSAHESSALNAELIAEFVEAARWNDRPADVTVRSHRHRYIDVRFMTARGIATSVCTPGWQGKTPFAWKIAGARLAPPQWGGIVIRHGDRRLFIDPYVETIGRSATV